MDITSYFTIMTATIAFGSIPLVATQKISSEQANQSMSESLLRFNGKELASHLPELIDELFTIIFGNRHFSHKCIMRSAITSMLSFFIIYFLLVLLFIFLHDLPFNTPEIWNYDLGAILLLLIFPFFLNVVPDYLSLLETRIIVRKMVAKPYLNIAFLLILDFIITLFIIEVFLIMILIINAGEFHSPLILVSKLNADLYGIVIGFIEYNVTYLNPFNVVLITALLTTFVTSVWVWLIATTIIFTKFTKNYGGVLWNYLFRIFLDTRNKPFEAMAYVWGVFVISIFTLASPFVFL